VAPVHKSGRRELGLLAACLVAGVLFTVASPFFLTGDNLATIVRSSIGLLVVALGMTIVLATGGIDIAVGATMALAAFFVGRAVGAAWPPVLAALIGPVAGLAFGAVTAAIVVVGRVPPIIATLGLYGIFRAAMFALLGGEWLSGLPDALGGLVKPDLLGVPVIGIELLILYLLAWAVLRRMPLGTWWLAIGGNETAARLAGVAVGRAKAAAYLASGLLAGVAGTVYVAQYRNVEMTVGSTIALDAIVAAVLGGASVTGGRASLLGTALGVVLVRLLQNGFVLIGVPSLWNQVVIGGLLLIVLASERADLRGLVRRPAR
jgi:AI-2 transport system permease protein